MSKTLILIRHSKPENRISSLKDHDRALTREGINDSKKMAGYFLETGIRPECILTSSARRALETASIFAEILKIDKGSIASNRNLYYSSPYTILNEIAGQSDEINCLMIVAHNPGLSELSRVLSSGGSSFMENTQVSLFEYEADTWSAIEHLKPKVFQSYFLGDIE